MKSTHLSSLIEAILFVKGDPVSLADLVEYTGSVDEDVEVAVTELAIRLESSAGGIRIVRKDGSVVLATSLELTDDLQRIVRSERAKDLGKAGLETLAIVVYRGPVSKAKIEYIRGVNSAFIIRNLLVRGLIERVANPEDQRSYLYRPTLEALAHLGITDVAQLPEYSALSSVPLDDEVVEEVLENLDDAEQ